MKTPAIISALTVVGSIAFAAGQSQTSRVIPVEEMPLEGEMPPMMAMGAGSCDQFALPETPWFAPVLRPIQVCWGGISYLPTSFWIDSVQQDVNGDGKTDYFYAVLATNVVTSSFNWVIAHQTYDSGEDRRERFVSVLGRQTVADALFQAYPGTTSVVIDGRMWRDMDDDGDLDIVIRFKNSSGGGVIQGWFENIGYEKPNPPLAADLNQDGTVDGIDLGMLLAAWTIP